MSAEKKKTCPWSASSKVNKNKMVQKWSLIMEVTCSVKRDITLPCVSWRVLWLDFSSADFASVLCLFTRVKRGLPVWSTSRPRTCSPRRSWWRKMKTFRWSVFNRAFITISLKHVILTLVSSKRSSWVLKGVLWFFNMAHKWTRCRSKVWLFFFI